MDGHVSYPLVVRPSEQGALVPVGSERMVVSDTQDWADASEADRFALLWRRFCKLACLFFLALAVLRCFRRQLLGLHVYLVELRRQLVELRLQANFWRAQHQRAVQREAALAERNRHLQGEIREWKRRLFGRKSESSSSTDPAKPTDAQPQESEESEASQEPQAASSTPSTNATNTNKPRRSRGQQPGSKGHGRRAHDHLPTTHEPCVLPESQQCCAKCGEPFEEIPGTADGSILEIDVRAHRRRYHRQRYRRH